MAAETDPRPAFRFSPNAYELGFFEPTLGECDGEFSDWVGIDGVPVAPDAAATVDLDEAREVSTRTPSYPTWQQSSGVRTAHVHARSSASSARMTFAGALVNPVPAGRGFMAP